jgi:hypothetical protein
MFKSLSSHTCAAVIFLLGAATSAPAQAQFRGRTTVEAQRLLTYGQLNEPRPFDNQEYDRAAVIWGTAVLGSLGMIAGGLAGYSLETNYTRCYGMYCGLAGLVQGALLGATVSFPLAAHLAAEEASGLHVSLALSAATLAAVYGLTKADAQFQSLFPIVPLLQASISISIATRRR